MGQTSPSSLLVWRGLLALLTVVIGVALVARPGARPEPASAPAPAPSAAPSRRPSSLAQPTSTSAKAFPSSSSGMAAIPAGSFQMGCDASQNAFFACFDNEQPLHEVFLDGYSIDRREVTNGEYAACVAASACSPPRSTASFQRQSYFSNPKYTDYPVIHVDWGQANEYCRWAGKRLPTEAEWEKAARGADDARPFPWGRAQPNCSRLNYWHDPSRPCVGDTTQVGAYLNDGSPFGALDMAGNVAEWVSDWYGETYYSGGANRNPTGPFSGQFKVTRGGSWRSEAAYARISVRQRHLPTDAQDALGFRCAASAVR